MHSVWIGISSIYPSRTIPRLFSNTKTTSQSISCYYFDSYWIFKQSLLEDVTDSSNNPLC